MNFKNINKEKIILFSGILFLVIGISFIFVLNINNLIPYINYLRGHSVSEIGLRKINRIYLLPVKILFITLGILLILIYSWLKWNKLLDIFYFPLKFYAEKLYKLKTFWILLIIFSVNFLWRVFLLTNISEFSLCHDAAEYIDVARNLFTNKGLVIHSLPYLWLNPSSIPYPVLNYPWGFPVLIFLSFKIFGVSFFSAGMVNVFFSSLIPILVYLLSYKITKDKKIALFSCILMSVNRIFLQRLAPIGNEISYTAFVLLCFIFLVSKPKVINFALSGVFLGLAFWIRYQAVILASVPIAVYNWIKFGPKKSISKVLIISIIALAVVSPILIRNYNLFGNPFFIKYNPKAAYQENFELSAMKTPSDTPFLQFISCQWKIIILTVIKKFITLILRTPVKITGSLILFLLAFYGLIITFKSNWRKYLFLYTHIGLYYIFFSFFMPHSRYLWPLIPFFIIFASIGFWNIVTSIPKNWAKIICVLISFSCIFSLTYGSISALGFTWWEAHLNEGPMKAAQYASYYLKNKKDVKTIMMASEQIRYVNYFLPEKNVVIFPNNLKDFQYLVKKYDVNYVIVPYVSDPYEKAPHIALRILNQYPFKQLVYHFKTPDIIIYKLKKP